MQIDELLDHYIKIQQEVYQSASDKEKSREICQLIDSYSNKCGQNFQFQQIFLGEKAFWQDDYESAIKNYLKARSVPHFQFFCFRASAFLSEKMGELEKAFDYAKKALSIMPHDKATAAILDKLSAQDASNPTCENEAKELKHIFEDRSIASLFLEEEPKEKIPLDRRHHRSDTHEIQIEEKLKQFELAQMKTIEHYQTLLEDRVVPESSFLTLLNGWELPNFSASILSNIIHADRLKHAPTGIYLRWKNKGIVINPGRQFLDHFHQSGYLLQDIHYVIITQCNPESYHDLMSLYLLNERLNEIGTKRHKIQYYINGKVHQTISPLLQPQYKDERHMLHPLEIFVDSSDIETLPLDDGILLKYFSTCPSAKDVTKRNTLGIVIELGDTPSSLKFGYLAGCAWSPLLASHLEDCQILSLGLGYTNEEDFQCKKYLPDALGYYGVYSLLQTLSPEILICLEFSGHKGDLRLDLINQIKHGCRTGNSTVSYAGDLGFYLDLELMQIRCSSTKELFTPQNIYTAKMQGPFSRLQYLSKDCVL